jgi:hypothetical protein
MKKAKIIPFSFLKILKLTEMIKRKIILLMTMLFACNYIYGQATTATPSSKRKIALWGHIVDSFNHIGIPNVHITLMNADSLVLDTLTASYSKGNAWNNADAYYRFMVPAEKCSYIIKAEHTDYETTYVNYNLRYTRTTYVDAPHHLMKRIKKKVNKEINLKEVTVTGTKIMMYHKGDTIVYNADAFNLPEGSMLDDLVRQLPGAEIKSNGDIYVNGRKLDYLTINGDDFMKGKNKLMLENLPYYIIKSLKVYEKNTTLNEYLGNHHDEKDYVMDVNLKRDYNIKNLGNAELAGGIPSRYLGRLFDLIRFENSSLMIIGSANNINETRIPGTDGNWSPSNSPKNEIRDAQFGLAWNVNSSKNKIANRLSLFGQFQNTDASQYEASESFLSNGNSYGRSVEANKQKTGRLYLSNYLTVKEPFYLESKTEIQYDNNNQTDYNKSATLNSDPSFLGGTRQCIDSLQKMVSKDNEIASLVNFTSESLKSHSHKWYIGENLQIVKKLPWNDDLEILAGFMNDNKYSDNYQRYNIRYFNVSDNTNDLRNIYRNEPNKQHSIKAGLNYTFNFVSRLQLTCGYKYSMFWNDHSRTHYRLDRLDSWDNETDHSFGLLPSNRDSMYVALDASNTYNSHLTKNSNNPSFSLYYEKKNDKGKDLFYVELNLPMNIDENKYHHIQGSLDTSIVRHYTYVQPYLKSKLWFSEKDYIVFEGHINVNQPDMKNLVETTDDTNPLRILKGNSNLKSSYEYYGSLFFSDYSENHHRGIWAEIEATKTDNAIAIGSSYNSLTGVYTMKPENVNGNYQTSVESVFNYDLDRKGQFSFNNLIGYYFQHSVDISRTEGEMDNGISKVNNHSFRENPTITWKHLKTTMSLHAQVDWVNSLSSRTGFTNIHALDFKYGLTCNTTLLWNVKWASDFFVYSRRGYGDASMNTNDPVWNMSISHSLLKNKITIKLTGFDIFGRLSNLSRVINAQGRTETLYNGTPRYIMLHAIFNFNELKKK